MTFFLQDQPQRDDIPGRVSPISEVPSWLEGTGWQKTVTDFESDSNWVSERYKRTEFSSLMGSVTERISDEEKLQILKDQGLAPPEMEQYNSSQFSGNMAAQQLFLEQARQQAADNPEAWEGVDLSDEGLDARTNKRLQADYDEAVAITQMLPEGRVGDGFTGSFLSAMTDIRQAPFLLAGGGAGSLLKVAGREAMINMSTEAYLLPSQFEMAERLDIDDPNITRQLRDAAIFGAAFGAGATALQRGAQYYMNRQSGGVEQLSIPEGFTGKDMEAYVDQIEEALLGGQDIPEMSIDAIRRQAPPSEVGLEAPPPRDPQDPGPAPQREPDTIEEALSSEIDGIRAETGSNRKPISDYMRSPRINELTGQKEPSGLQVKPGSRAADELAAMGITSRTRPGVFSKNGRSDFDDLVASEWEDTFPGISDAAGVSTNGYLDQDGFLSVLANELNDGPPMLRDRQRLADAEIQLEEYRRQRDTLQRQMDPIPDSDDIQATQAAMNDIKDHVAQSVRMAGLEDVLTASQRADMESILANRGGSVDELLDAMDEQDLSFAERDLGEPDGPEFAPRDESDLQSGDELGAGRGDLDGPSQDGRPEESSRGRQEAGNGAIAGPDRSIFSEPGEAADLQRNITADLRDSIEADGDFDIEMEVDGRKLTSAQQVLDYLDEGERFSSRIDLCGMGPK